MPVNIEINIDMGVNIGVNNVAMLPKDDVPCFHVSKYPSSHMGNCPTFQVAGYDVPTMSPSNSNCKCKTGKGGK